MLVNTTPSGEDPLRDIEEQLDEIARKLGDSAGKTCDDIKSQLDANEKLRNKLPKDEAESTAQRKFDEELGKTVAQVHALIDVKTKEDRLRPEDEHDTLRLLSLALANENSALDLLVPRGRDRWRSRSGILNAFTVRTHRITRIVAKLRPEDEHDTLRPEDEHDTLRARLDRYAGRQLAKVLMINDKKVLEQIKAKKPGGLPELLSTLAKNDLRLL